MGAQMTRTRVPSLAWGVSLALLLAACGSGAAGDVASRLGQSFASAFRIAEDGTPTEPGNITYERQTGENLTSAPADF
jgi:hypothetical protein